MSHPLRRALPAGILVLLAACSGSGASSSPSTAASEEAPSLAASEAPSVAASPSEAAVSEAPSQEADAGDGLALADVDAARLREALEGFGFTFGDPETGDDGETIERGTAEDGDVEVVFSHVDNTPTQVALFDYSAGEVGLEEIGFLLGIFQPDAQDWLVEQLDFALETPGTPVTAEMSFQNVDITIEYFTDEYESLDVYFE